MENEISRDAGLHIFSTQFQYAFFNAHICKVRDKWVPDALAQLKFSPKMRSPDIAKIVEVSIIDL